MTTAAQYPDFTDNAIAVLNRRYLVTDPDTDLPAEQPDNMFRRVAHNLSAADYQYGADEETVAETEERFYRVMRSLEFLPNSPTLMNAGRTLQQLSACFVLPIEDSLFDIFTTVRSTTLIHQSGGGTGFSFSRLRPEGDVVSSTGKVASGPASFIRAFDVATDVVKQGGTRRGANMGVLSVYHPDVRSFINLKADGKSISNFNISIAVDRAFMEKAAAGKEYQLINPRTNLPVATENASDILNAIVRQAWLTGDPGLLFLDRMNADNPNPQLGEIETTNPCVTADTWTMTADGPRQVRDLIGTSYCSIDSYGVHDTDARGFYCSGNQAVFHLTTEEGYTVRLTAQHQVKTVLCEDAESIIYAFTPANQLRPGDRIKLQDHRASPHWLAPPQGDRCPQTDFEALDRCREHFLRDPDTLRDLHMSSYRYHCDLIAKATARWSTHDPDSACLTVPAGAFAPDLHLMLSRVGIHSTRDGGVLHIHGPDLDALLDVVQHAIPTSVADTISQLRRRQSNAPRLRHATFKALEPAGHEDVFDVTVPDNPEFDANGLHLHNCLSANTRLATHRGQSKLGDLHQSQAGIAVLTDSRVPDINTLGGSRGPAMATKTRQATTLRLAVPVFKTRSNWPVFRMRTKRGFEIVATDDHKFYTSNGPVQLKDLNIGDEILIQGGPGTWNDSRALPRLDPHHGPQAQTTKHNAGPTEWSPELAHLVGWAATSSDTAGPDQLPRALNLIFAGKDRQVMAPLFASNVRRLFGFTSSESVQDDTTTLRCPPDLQHFLRYPGFANTDPPDQQRVPDAIWNAPKDAVQAFLSATFTACASIDVSPHVKSCSFSMTSQSKPLLQDLQLLLLNFGVIAEIRQCPTDQPVNPTRDSHTRPTYAAREQHTLIINNSSCDIFLRHVGFMSPAMQSRAESWQEAHGPAPQPEKYTDRIDSIEFAGLEDVFCTTEPETHSIIANGFVTAQCGEQSLLPYESCNLGSINLARMTQQMPDGSIQLDEQKLQETADVAVHLLDNVIDMNQYPLPEIEQITKATRRIGVGVMGFADLLIMLGIRYDSEQGTEMANTVMSMVRTAVHTASQKLAQQRGPFPEWHRSSYRDSKLMRNSAPTTIAPTGTISIIAGASSGIEPLFALAYVRNVMDNTELSEVNQHFRDRAQRDGFYSQELMEKIARGGGHIPDDNEDIPPDVKDIYRTAHQISAEWHVQMQAAFQSHTDNAVSKTVNLPHDASEQDVANAYQTAYRLGCKGITVYRDGSKADQVLSTTAHHADQTPLPAPPHYRTRPRHLSGSTDRVRTGHGNTYVTVNQDQDGRPFEVFATTGKAGGCDAALMEACNRLVSIGLRWGIPTDDIVKQLAGIACCPFWDDGVLVGSPVDAVAKVLDHHNPDRTTILGEPLAFQPPLPQEQIADLLPRDVLRAIQAPVHHDEPPYNARFPRSTCPECEAPLVYQEGCPKCYSCGWTNC